MNQHGGVSIDLIVFSLIKLDVTLSVDWLTRHSAMANRYVQEIILDLSEQVKVVF